MKPIRLNEKLRVEIRQAMLEHAVEKDPETYDHEATRRTMEQLSDEIRVELFGGEEALESLYQWDRRTCNALEKKLDALGMQFYAYRSEAVDAACCLSSLREYVTGRHEVRRTMLTWGHSFSVLLGNGQFRTLHLQRESLPLPALKTASDVAEHNNKIFRFSNCNQSYRRVSVAIDGAEPACVASRVHIVPEAHVRVPKKLEKKVAKLDKLEVRRKNQYGKGFDLSQDLKTALKAFRTTKQLFEQWPEVEPVVTPILRRYELPAQCRKGEATPNLPGLPLKSLSERIGLLG